MVLLHRIQGRPLFGFLQQLDALAHVFRLLLAEVPGEVIRDAGVEVGGELLKCGDRALGVGTVAAQKFQKLRRAFLAAPVVLVSQPIDAGVDARLDPVVRHDPEALCPALVGEHDSAGRGLDH